MGSSGGGDYPYGLKVNPYSLAVPTPGEEVARVLGGKRWKRAREDILSHMKRKGFFLTVIQGMPGVGKTQLLLNLKAKASEMKGVKTSYIRMSEEEDLSLRRHYRRLKGILGIPRRRRVLEVDEVDMVCSNREFLESLKSLIDSRPGDLFLVLAITPEVLTKIEEISSPLASRIRSPHLFYDFSPPDLDEIYDIVLEYLSSFGAQLGDEDERILKEGVSYIYSEMKVRELRDVLSIMEQVLEISRERGRGKITLEDFEESIRRARPGQPVEGSITGMRYYEYLSVLKRLPPRVSPQRSTNTVQRSVIQILRAARNEGLIKSYYPRGKKLETPGGKRSNRIIDIFFTTSEGNLAADIKLKEEDDAILTMSEIENVIDVARFNKDVERVLVITNGTPPQLAISKLAFVKVDRVRLADILFLGEKLRNGIPVSRDVISEILRDLTILV